MRVLIAGNGGPLASAVERALSGAHDVRVVGAAEALDRERAGELTAGRDVVIHFPLLAEPASSGLAAPDALERLEVAGRATYNLIMGAAEAGVSRFVLVSTLRHFERYPVEWLVTERWAPRPSTHIDGLAPYLAEMVVRETSRVLPLRGIGLRMGRVHEEDAVQAVERAMEWGGGGNGWHVFHIVGAGKGTRFALGQAGEKGFGYVPRYEEVEEVASAQELDMVPQRAGARAAERVVVFGAGGPIASAFAAHAESDHVLRLVDIRALGEIVAEGKPFGPGAPLPRVLGAPHEIRVGDITDLTQVMEAVEGMDAIVNLTAMRNHPVEAFRVNVLGPYNVMRAAVSKGIGKVVLSGPSQISLGGPAGYTYDDDEITADVPARPGTELYFVSKLLGQSIARIFALECGIEVPCLLIGPLLNPDPALRPVNVPHGAYPFSVSWEDAGEAVRCALDAGRLPRAFEPMFVVGDVPHARFSNEKTKQLIGWEPKDRLEKHWLRELD